MAMLNNQRVPSSFKNVNYFMDGLFHWKSKKYQKDDYFMDGDFFMENPKNQPFLHRIFHEIHHPALGDPPGGRRGFRLI